ncbi:aldose 1-epimerase family protein [Yinghuangia seranimata]|uniref:aldose 1-epimerase family protein n=1 Tax=Yinghuangia seranimata TaxID=408067 RepID=UPI00248B2C70|nr:aldose 1-epimerase family protein [Yinghuangia seranimata]MDI2125502.1 aldose 1-epimerase family protein [Yinghuangia seranimata]
MPTSPSGHQIELRHGDQTAVVVELGAALRHYSVAGRPVLAGFSAAERIVGGRGQVLAPWPNRISGGRYTWDGEEQQLPLTEPAHGNAIHGLLRWTSWQVAARDPERAELTATVWPQPGYPFAVAVHIEYALGPGGLAVTITARNIGDAAAPYGIGQHPYLTVGTDLVDDALLTLPVAQRLPGDGTAAAVAGTEYDFRTPRPVGPGRLDTAFTELTRGADGRAVVTLAHPSGGHGTDLWLGEGAEFLQVFTGDTLASSARRRSIAVEPMSCPADAFRTGVGLVTLAPDARHVLRWGLTSWSASS